MSGMNTGVIGVGMMGRNHLRVYSELKGVGDVFVYDINGDAVEEIKRGGKFIA